MTYSQLITNYFVSGRNNSTNKLSLRSFWDQYFNIIFGTIGVYTFLKLLSHLTRKEKRFVLVICCFRYERTGPRRSLAFQDDALYRHYEEQEAANEQYVDNPEDRLGYRESPLGCSGTYRYLFTHFILYTYIYTSIKGTFINFFKN